MPVIPHPPEAGFHPMASGWRLGSLPGMNPCHDFPMRCTGCKCLKRMARAASNALTGESLWGAESALPWRF